MKIAAWVLVSLVCSPAVATEPIQRTLDFDDRVKAQSAIERVYYSHQLGTTKPFAEAVPRAVLEAKVQKYLEQSAALNKYWKTAVTDETLQRELERMAQGTKMPERLLELYAVLGNDPFLIKECLARPALVDRLTRNFYAFDRTHHSKERALADALHRVLVSGALSPSVAHPNRTVVELVIGEPDAVPPLAAGPFEFRLTPKEFRERRGELPVEPGQVSEVKETRDAFVLNVILSETATTIRVATYVVPKTSWDVWRETARRNVSGDSVTPIASGQVGLPAPQQSRPVSPNTMCQDDFWNNGVLDGLPSPRAQHTAVWTGSVMVIWGGYRSEAGGGLNTGGRYDPATDSWIATSTIAAPFPRYGHTAVWTGSLMLVWGGVPGFRSGGRYDPMTDSWTPTSLTGAPSSRNRHTAVWTGSLMLVWGGTEGSQESGFNDGGRYDPETNRWAPTSTTGAPSGRYAHTAVWTGDRMVIWGGHWGYNEYGFLDTGGRYDPATDRWTPTSQTNAPYPRGQHTAVWTGSLMVIWGGYGPTYPDGGWPLFDGGRYDPATDRWSPTSEVGAPSARYGHTAVWTGSEMIVWGPVNTGGRYDPATDTWTPTATTGAPIHRTGYTAVWTGSLMVIWGGADLLSNFKLNDGGRYDPATDGWTPTSMTGAPSERRGHSAVWTGSVMAVWGGREVFAGAIDTGGRYDPAVDNWTPTSTIGAPTPRSGHTAVWTDNLMVVWGGSGGTYLNTGGRYDPAADSWTPMSTADAPSARSGHTAVGPPNLMVVWGGYDGHYLITGGRYDPTADRWAPTSTADAPSARTGHTVVWTGDLMVVWGGQDHGSPSPHYLDTGGGYDPVSDLWISTSTTGAPSARSQYTAVWTGRLMLIWGGYDGSRAVNSGGRYDPATGTWTPISTTGAPSERVSHTAVWTGSLMVVWGGSSSFDLNTGGRYDPATDSWTPTSTAYAPTGRTGHTAVWTGSAMVVWGGGIRGREGSGGGRYYPGTVLDDDCDGDGLTASAGDCNDHDVSVYPGAAQLCDGFNTDCADPSWPALPADELDADEDGIHICQGDCNDQDFSVYPGAAQICDGVNNDCNDPTWPIPAPTEADSDSDGVRICDGDCDDGNPKIAPGVWDSCDGLDNDCDGVVDNGIGPVCYDGNPCTDDSCGGAAGCIYLNNTALCNDYNECTSGDSCSGGGCFGTPLTGSACDDGNPCTADDSCLDGACSGGPEVHCDDGNLCNGLEYCDPYIGCRPGATLDCEDHFLCTDDSCDPLAGCIYTNNTNSCDDRVSCTGNDRCAGGYCRGTPLDGAVCDDGNACTSNDVCVAGSCQPGTGTLDCSDDNPCTTDFCFWGTGCLHENNSDSCSDGNVCTIGDYCIYGGCAPGMSTLDCIDSNPCTDDSCDPISGCVNSNNAQTCDDGNVCTVKDVCGSGVCRGMLMSDAVCDDGNDCTASDNCVSGVCRGTSLNDTPCDDGNVCTTNDTCGGGVCQGAAIACDDGNPCTTDACSPATGCVFTNNTNPCDDGDVCTRDDRCSDGYCYGGSLSNCDDGDGCTDDYCDSEGLCVHFDNTNPCDDGNLCTFLDRCGGGTCNGGPPVVCNDSNDCTTDTCDPNFGCVSANNADPCSDGNACTAADACSDGTCSGGAPLDCDDRNVCTIDVCDPSSGCVHTLGDKSPPEISCSPSVTIECQADLQSGVELSPAVATDACQATNVIIANDHTPNGANASGSYPLGTTIVTFTATDTEGNSATCQTAVSISDSIPPVVTVRATPHFLWPPDHAMYWVHNQVERTDACDPSVAVALDLVVSSEADDAPGGSDGYTTNDVQDTSIGTPDFDILLRAERMVPGRGRTYTMQYTAVDQSGNVGAGTATVGVRFGFLGDAGN